MMIVYRRWEWDRFGYESDWEGWFLLGVIPLYLRRIMYRKAGG